MNRAITLSFPGASVNLANEDSTHRHLLVLSAIEMPRQSLQRDNELDQQTQEGLALARFLRAMLPQQTLDSLIRGLA